MLEKIAILYVHIKACVQLSGWFSLVEPNSQAWSLKGEKSGQDCFFKNSYIIVFLNTIILSYIVHKGREADIEKIYH